MEGPVNQGHGVHGLGAGELGPAIVDKLEASLAHRRPRGRRLLLGALCGTSGALDHGPPILLGGEGEATATAANDLLGGGGGEGGGTLGARNCAGAGWEAGCGVWVGVGASGGPDSGGAAALASGEVAGGAGQVWTGGSDMTISLSWHPVDLRQIND